MPFRVAASRWTAAPVGLALILGQAHVLGQALACAPDGAATVSVARVTPEGELALSDGRLLLPAGVEPWRDPADAALLHQEPRRWIAEAIAQGPVTARILTGGQDRWARERAEIFLDGVHLQTALAAAGAAIALPAGADPCAASVRAAERAARAAKLRMWSGEAAPFARADDAAALNARIGRVVVAEGRARRLAVVGNRVYLDFGPQGSGALTVVMRKATLTKLAASGLKPQDWTGARVAVRGRLERRRGPTIEIAGPEGIETIGRP